MNTEKPELLTDILHRRCLGKDGAPADHARGLLAGLRKLLSPATETQGIFALGQLGAGERISRRDVRAVAGLFALYPHRCARNRNFGQTCRDLATGENSRPGDAAFDRHFRRILAARTLDDLIPPLLRAGRMARAKGAEIDYRQLERDLARFRHSPDDVLERWTKSYFGTEEPAVQLA